MSAAKAEHDALARALEHGGGSAIASLSAQPGYERALAAALGEDADAAVGAEGARRWSGSGVMGSDPKLAVGLESLADFVEAPSQLQRRLQQVGVCDSDQGQPLEVGQRLVTRDGQLRRWDGFVSEGAGAATAERLIRSNRLAELARQLPNLEKALTDKEDARAQASGEVDRFRAMADEARAAGAASERESREAGREADSAAAAIERLEAQRVGLTERVADLAPVLEASRDAIAAAERSLASLPDPAALEQELVTARDKAAVAAAAVADQRAAAATRAREMASDRERHGAAGRERSDWERRQAEAEARLVQALERQKKQMSERDDLEDEPERLAKEIHRVEQSSSATQAEVAAAVEAEQEAERLLAAAAEQLAQRGEEIAGSRERRAAAMARAEAQQARSAEYARVCVERFECVPQRLPEQMGFDASEVRDPEAESAMLERLTAERERLGPVNLVAEQELAEIDDARSKGAEEAEELTQAIHRLRGSIGSLNREGRVRLLEAFEQVNTHFRSLFTTLFDGGQAHLELVESEDPLEAGLEIMVQPPGKRLSTLTLLSGGEQALTAIALIFALFLTNPAPICVLDEVDAPLDDANVERFCDLLDRMTQETDTRYLIVTHNAVTMSRMHRLYGVTMIEKGVSRLVSVDLGGATTLLAAE